MPGFLGQDWSGANFKEKLGGLLTPEGQQGLLSNPMFGAGMGLLSSSYDKRINPYGAIMQGMSGASDQKDSQEDRRRMEELRKQLAAYFAAQQGGMRQGGQPMPPTNAPPGMPPGGQFAPPTNAPPPGMPPGVQGIQPGMQGPPQAGLGQQPGIEDLIRQALLSRGQR